MELKAIINGHGYTVEGDFNQDRLDMMIKTFTERKPKDISFISFCKNVFGEEVKLISFDGKNEDDIRDIAIRIVDKLVLNNLIKNCIDTDDETEFEAQDIISEELKKINIH